jgi:hypothetical protein
MSETTQTTQETIEQNQQPAAPQQSLNPFDDSSWSTSPVVPSEPLAQNSNVSEGTTASTSQPQTEEEVLDSNEWLKREFSWESVDAAKQELEELRKLREAKQSGVEEIEFENEESMNLFRLFKEGKQDEVYSYLETRRKLDNLVNAELNRDTASEIIKMNMQKSYPDLTRDEIEFKFNREFGIPAKPVQQDIETDDEYKDRLDVWQSQVKNIETELMIEAKLVKPDLQKYRNELVLPEIENSPNSYEPTQEELEAQKKFVDYFKQSANSALSSFDGFSVSVKDEEVDIPLSYAISQEEKGVVAQQLERFADSGFDANVILAERWLKADGDINTNQIVKDLALLLSEGKMSQKFVNEAASKRLAEHIRRTSNISVTSRTPQQTFNPESKSDLDKQIEYIWKNS